MPRKKTVRVRFLTPDPEFKHTVLATLNDPTSWGVRVIESEPPDVIMGINTSRKYSKIIKGQRVYFSVTFIDLNPPVILFDPYNYYYGVKQSQLNVHDYRRYVINHEFGHVLGKDHLRCRTNQECPVMYQMTRGIPRRSRPNSRVTLRDRRSPSRKNRRLSSLSSLT